MTQHSISLAEAKCAHDAVLADLRAQLEQAWDHGLFCTGEYSRFEPNVAWNGGTFAEHEARVQSVFVACLKSIVAATLETLKQARARC